MIIAFQWNKFVFVLSYLKVSHNKNNKLEKEVHLKRQERGQVFGGGVSIESWITLLRPDLVYIRRTMANLYCTIPSVGPLWDRKFKRMRSHPFSSMFFFLYIYIFSFSNLQTILQSKGLSSKPCSLWICNFNRNSLTSVRQKVSSLPLSLPLGQDRTRQDDLLNLVQFYMT